jgi:hypothetical protein
VNSADIANTAARTEAYLYVRLRRPSIVIIFIAALIGYLAALSAGYGAPVAEDGLRQKIRLGIEEDGMKYTVFLLMILVAGCERREDEQAAHSMPMSTVTESRIKVTRISVFKDGLAYGDYRGIYVIEDNKTGEEFIGISGIGITEVGHHHCGKACTSPDER